MQFTTTIISTLLLTISLLTSASPLPLPRDPDADLPPPCDAACETDSWMFQGSLEGFNLQRKSMWAAGTSPVNGVDWILNSDGCSVPDAAVDFTPISDKDFPGGFNFLNSCYRHDFGYANYKAQGRFNEDNRGKIDNKFRDDLYDECRKQPGFDGVKCRRLADIYWHAVRQFGDTA